MPTKLNKCDGISMFLGIVINFMLMLAIRWMLILCGLLLNLIKNNMIQVLVIYRLPNGSVGSILNDYLSSLSKDRSILLIRDMNINVLDNDLTTQIYLDVIRRNEFVSYVNKPSRINGNKKSCIDRILPEFQINVVNKKSLISLKRIFPITLQ